MGRFEEWERKLRLTSTTIKIWDVYEEMKQTIEQQQEKIKWLESHNELLKDTDYEIKVKPTFKF